MNLISIVVPTFRPESSTIPSFFNLDIPINYDLEFIFIIDNPEASTELLYKMKEKYNNKKITIIHNNVNMGASYSRNVGIDNSKGDLILFLDDDCLIQDDLLLNYIEAIKKYPNHPGYIGLTKSPKSKTNFHRSVELSDMQHFWNIAERKETFYWGITANIIFWKSAIGNVRFPIEYPKKGGGEDINFCLKVIENYNKFSNNQNLSETKKKNHKREKNVILKCVPKAKIEHPFWNEDIPNYLRFFRWGWGDVNLQYDFPNLCFWQYPNTIEYLFLILLMMVIKGIFNYFNLNILLKISINLIFWFLLLITIGIIFWELYCEAKKFKIQKRDFNLISLAKAVFIRQLNDWGRFFKQFPKFWTMGKRWDYFCSGESINYERNNAKKKFLGYLGITITVFLSLYFL